MSAASASSSARAPVEEDSLEKLEAGAERVPVKVNPAEASAYIVNPLRGRNASNLFMTHPPVPERIARLRSGAWAV